MAMHRLRALHVLAALRSGSSSPIVVATDGGRFVTKLRGAAQGTASLIAEIVVAELAERLGLSVPERVLIELDAGVSSDDRNDELRALLDASAGLNLGFRHLADAVPLTSKQLDQLDDEFAARLLWLDGLVMNPDRTEQNPNLLLWRRQPWLIDHGAALGFQHDFARVTEQSPREPADHRQHLLAARTALLPRYDAVLARSMDRESLARAVAEVPEDFLRTTFADQEPERMRAAYTAFLWKRLKAPRPFVGPA